VIVFKHAAPTTAAAGTIAGVLYPVELSSAVRSYLGRVGKCDELSVDIILSSIFLSLDILADGTNQPNTSCNGISIGLGFEADEISDSTTVVADPVTSPSSCD
jgi:hypothetical protein